MRSQSGVRKILLLVLSLILMVVLSVTVSCEPTIVFKVENRTDDVVDIYISGYPIGEVLPGKANEISIPHKSTRYLLEAKNEHGEVVYSKEFNAYQLSGSNIVVDSTE